MNLKFILPADLYIQFLFLKNNKVLIVKNKTNNSYIVIPSFILSNKVNNFLLFTLLDNNKKNLFIIFVGFFQNWLKAIKKPIIKKLILKGLGLKANILNNILELKLGFSHSINISLQKYKLKISINKNVILIEGSNLLEIGTFLNKIRSLKRPNIYKGKGIWYKNEVLKLKPIKKT